MKYKPEVVIAYFESQGIQIPAFELKFHPIRRWRFDMAWIEEKVYLEVDGGIWVRGGHNRGAQMKKDWEKRNAASAMGWRGLWCEPKDLCINTTAEQIKAALNYGGNNE